MIDLIIAVCMSRDVYLSSPLRLILGLAVSSVCIPGGSKVCFGAFRRVTADAAQWRESPGAGIEARFPEQVVQAI
ncbi:MAG: hypothetical protein CYG59_08420, partial [Chloroflexi bacterium]